MRNIKIIVEYDGKNFNGWQIQETNDRTVQGEIEKALLKIFGPEAKLSRLFGSGRTDSGAHAIGQVANFKVDTEMSTREIMNALNGNLPEDIAIVDAKDVDQDFHSQFDAKKKTYRYVILHRKIRGAFQKGYYWYYPYKLNLSLLKREAKDLIGTKDFCSFMASNPKKKKNKDTIRTIYEVKITKKKDFIFIEITANGFLYKMVRNIVGTLVDVGNGRRPPGSVKTILKEKNRIYASETAPAKGLCLLEVLYK
jgi:tRNA pseudouridine38-40 synthase